MRKPLWMYLACCIAVFMISARQAAATGRVGVVVPGRRRGVTDLPT